VKNRLAVNLLPAALLGVALCSARAADDAEQTQPGKPSILLVRHASGWVHGEAFFREYARGLVDRGYVVGVRDMEATYHNSKGDLTFKDIEAYDVIALLNPPWWVPETGRVSPGFMEIWQAILKHVENGGGLLFCPSVAGSYRAAANQLLAALGASFVNGALFGDKTITATVMQIAWAYTDELADHPVAKEVRGLWHPVANSRFVWNANTVPFRLDDAWTVLARAERTVRVEDVDFNDPRVDEFVPKCPSNVATAPPLLAVRDYGKGRVALCGVQASYHVNGGLAPGYERIVMGVGLDAKPSDMPTLLDNLFGWLGEPAAGGRLFTGAKTDAERLEPPKFEPPEPLDMARHAYPGPKKGFRGVIGARTTYSTGKSTPEQYVQAAKEAGFSFLVILEDYEHITEQSFHELQKKCEALNADDFLVFVGLTYQDEVDNSYFAFKPGLVFPQEAWMVSGTKRFKTIYEKASGLSLNEFAQKNGSNRCFIGHYRPEKGKGVPFWDIRTYRNTLAVLAYVDGRKLDDMTEEYGVVSDAAELPRSMALTLMHDAADVAKIAAGEMPHTVLLAHKLKDLWDQAGESNNFTPVAYATEGPHVDAWQWAGPRDYVANGNWYDWTRYLWKARMSVRSDVGLKEIRVMDGTVLFRRFLPGGAKTFEQEIVLSHNQQHHLWLIVTDSAGKRAFAENLIDRNHLMEFVYCGDRNNTLSYAGTAAPDSPWASTAGNWVLPTQPKGPMTDNLRIDMNLDQLRFPGFDGQASGGAWTFAQPYFWTEQGTEGGAINRQIKLPMACADAVIQENVISHKFAKGVTVWNSWNNLGPLVDRELFRGTVRYTTFIHPGHLPAPVLVEGELEFLKDLTFDPRRILHLCTARATAGRKEGGYRMAAIQHTTGRSHAFELDYGKRPQQLRAHGTLQRGGYGYFYPSLFGPFGVFSLQEDMRFFYTAENKTIQFGLNFAGKAFKKGDRASYRFLAFTSAYNDRPSLEVPEAFRDVFALDGEPGYETSIQQGEILSQEYVLRIDGQGQGFCGVVSPPKPAPFPAVLPIIVENLNQRWTAVCLDRKTNEARPLGMLDNAAHAHVAPTSQAASLFIGHPFTCDQPHIFLTAAQVGEKQWLLSLHNPTDQPLDTNVQRSRWFGLVPSYPIKALVPPGQTVKIDVPKKG